MNAAQRLREHPDAPRWNHSASDRLSDCDRVALREFSEALATQRGAANGGPSPALVRRTAALMPHVPRWRTLIPRGCDLQREWSAIPTSSRADLALRPETMIPDTADLTQLIVYRTAGTTGHALHVPHSARAAAAYQPLIAHALARYGVAWSPTAKEVACFCVGAQIRTVTYATTLSLWGGAGFAKLNLRDWAAPPQRYFADMGPLLLTGDPISFSEMLRLGIRARPVAMVSTAVAMSSGLRDRLAREYACPIIDWYSLTETGPIAYWCRFGGGYHVLPHDLEVEIVDERGMRLAPGERGEVAVSGGRNPFLPLLRYRTGDFAKLDVSVCSCGDPTPRLIELEGRAPVLLRAHDGRTVNPVDLSRILREFPFAQHELSQQADGRCELVVRPLGSFDEGALRAALQGALGPVSLVVRIDAELGDRQAGKVVPYKSACKLED